MRASTQTPATMALLLPRQLRQRYSGSDFSWRMSNFVLAHLEKELESPYYITDFGLNLVENLTNYPYPVGCRQIRGVYESLDLAVLMPNKSEGLHFDDYGDKIRLISLPALREEESIEGIITTPGSGELDTLLDTVNLIDPDLDEDDLIGFLAMVTHANGVVESRYIKANDPVAGTVTLNGNLNALAATADTFLITPNFLIVEGVRYLTRVTADTDTLDIPEDWEECFLHMLRLRYELQADETSPNVQTYRNEANASLRRLKGDARHRVNNPLRKPRHLPTCWP